MDDCNAVSGAILSRLLRRPKSLIITSHDVHRVRGNRVHVPAPRHYRRVRRAQDSPERVDVDRRAAQRRCGVGAGDRSLRGGRLLHDCGQHLRLHRREGRASHEHGLAVRRILGLDARPVLRHRAVPRVDLPLCRHAPHRLRDGGGAGHDVLHHDQLHARAGPNRSSTSARSASWNGPNASSCS